MAAEYILKEGNERVILCERGIRTFETAYRFTLDLMAVPVLKQLSHLPVVVDPSHAAGRRDLVGPLSLAAAAAGADGIIVEVHPNPEEAICDGPQALRADEFAEYAANVERAAAIAGKVFSARVKVAVVGVGLIGGSIGLAARSRLGAQRHRLRPGSPRRRGGARARRDRALPRRASPRRSTAPSWSFVAAPVSALGAAVDEALAGAPADCVVTRRRLHQARDRRRARRPAIRRRPSARRRRDLGRRARARRPLRRRDVVPDAGALRPRERSTSACTARSSGSAPSRPRSTRRSTTA